MKKISILLVLVLLLCLVPAAHAEDGVQVEVLIADGMSVVMLTPDEMRLRANEVFQSAAPNGGDGSESLALPASLTLIEESAFEGIAAQRVEISENVVSIGKRAFADSKSLREIVIPATVLKVDDLALEGCENVTVYGAAGSEADGSACRPALCEKIRRGVCCLAGLDTQIESVCKSVQRLCREYRFGGIPCFAVRT